MEALEIWRKTKPLIVPYGAFQVDLLVEVGFEEESPDWYRFGETK